MLNNAIDDFDSLDLLAKKYGTDKCTQKVGRLSPKGYTKQYSRYFSPLRNRKIKLLEIGIAEGASLKMWEEYFPNAEIFGIDINLKSKMYETKRTKVFVGDQKDRAFLRSVIKEVGSGLDVVVDDGGHKMSQHKASLEELFPNLVPGGIYAIEDLHTAYWRDYEGGYLKEGTTIEYLKSLIDGINGVENVSDRESFVSQIWHRAFNIKRLAAINTLENLEGIHFYKSIAFLFKGNACKLVSQ